MKLELGKIAINDVICGSEEKVEGGVLYINPQTISEMYCQMIA